MAYWLWTPQNVSSLPARVLEKGSFMVPDSDPTDKIHEGLPNGPAVNTIACSHSSNPSLGKNLAALSVLPRLLAYAPCRLHMCVVGWIMEFVGFDVGA